MNVPGVLGRRIEEWLGWRETIALVEFARDWYAQWDIERDGLVGLSMLINYAEKTPEQKLAEILKPYQEARRCESVIWATGIPGYE
jgi:hypothetical protein